jgi:hypothetical protein
MYPRTEAHRHLVDSSKARPRGTRRRTGSAARRRFRFAWERVEDRTLLATIQVTSTSDRTFEADNVLTLRDAIELVNGDLTVGQLSASQQALVTGTPDQPGVTDTIDFNIPFNDPGHFYYKDDGTSGSVSRADIAAVPTVVTDGVTPITSDAQLADPNLVGAGNTIDPDWAHSWWSIQIADIPMFLEKPVFIDGYSQPGAQANTLTGYDLQLMSWGDGSNVPTSGRNLVIAGLDNDGLLHIRTFDYAGVRTDTYEEMEGGALDLVTADAAGHVLSDTPESNLPAAQAQAIADLKQRLPDLLPPYSLSDTERSDVLSEATLITGQTPLAHNIEIDGSNSNSTGDDDWAFWIFADAVTLRGLAEHGVQDIGFAGLLGNGDRVSGCFLGTDVSGTVALGNTLAVGGNGAQPMIGGTAPGDRNIISGNEQGIFLQSQGAVIQGNYIGTDASGTKPLGNDTGLVISSYGSIGGTTPGAGNLISGNHYGLELGGSDHALVQGNFIGTDVTGTRAIPNIFGINQGSSCIIGGPSPGAGNLISGNGYGITGEFDGLCSIEGNLIGTDVTGTKRLGNDEGIFIGGANVTIGGLNEVEPDGTVHRTAGNVISGNGDGGIRGGSGFHVEGNYIGTDITGTKSLGNGIGIRGDATTNMTIGGTTPAARNIISGNDTGISLATSTEPITGNVVEGNYIGTDVTGLHAVRPDYGTGILIGGIAATNNTIGGTTPGAGNRISGIGGDGITVAGNGFGPASANVIEGNDIGTDATGEAALGNGFGTGGMGIRLFDGVNNTIGGTAPGAGNVISGNALGGVDLGQCCGPGLVAGNILQGNLIGTDATGTHALGNASGVLLVDGTGDNTIGGTTPGAGNVISGNTDWGLDFGGSSSDVVEGNLIGTDITGTQPLGNGVKAVGDPYNGGGVLFDAGAVDNTLGGTTSGAGNVIAYNAHHGGVVIAQLSAGAPYYITGDTVRGNSIHDNIGLGIDLGDDGVTPNGSHAGQPGTNNWQNYPVLSAAYSGPSTFVMGTLQSSPNTTFTVDFYANTAPDPSNYGEGQLYLGATTVTTDSSGNASFAASGLMASGAGQWISATATDPSGDTSEFSQDVQVSPAVFWANDVSGDWDNPSMWSSGAVPGPGDVAVIPFADIMVTHASSTADAVNRLISQAAIGIAGGSLSIASASTIQNTLTVTGAMLATAGDLTVNGLLTLGTGGALSGTGTINANVTNGGQVIPGGTGAAGLLIINGNYTQTATGSLNIELGGPAAGSSDQLGVSGTATLGGTLNVATIGSFTPALGNTFQVVTFGSSSGNFNTCNGTNLANGLFLDPVFQPTNVALDVDQVAISGAPALPLPGVPINLNGSVTGPSVGHPSVFSYAWTVTQNGNPYQSGSGSAFSFTPNLVATYLATLTVTDATGGRGTTTVPVVVPPSIFVLNATANAALSIAGGASITVPGGVVVDSSSSSAISLTKKSQLSASVIDVLGGAPPRPGSSVSPPPATGVSIPDPLAALTGPNPTGLNNYGSISLNKGTLMINPGIYSEIKVSNSASLTLNPGIYIIEGGGLTVTGSASISGSGVMIYNAGSNYPSAGGKFSGITLSSAGAITLSAPTSGPYAGVLIFQSHENTLALSFSGGALTGLNGTIYAPSAPLSLTGSAQLQQGLVVGMLIVSGPIALTQMAAGSDGLGDTAGIANTLLAGNLTVYINDPSGSFTSDELARIQDAINAWDAILAPYNVTITEVSDPSMANIVIDTSTTSACGGMANGVLGCYNEPNAEITMIQGWNWYAGSDPSQIGPGQYDFETTVLHELGHALGLGGSTDPGSPMFETLEPGTTHRIVTTQDLNIPDPPAGADPLTAGGFPTFPASASVTYAQQIVPAAAATPPIAVWVPPPGVLAPPINAGLVPATTPAPPSSAGLVVSSSPAGRARPVPSSSASVGDTPLASSLEFASEADPAPPSDLFTDPDDFRWERPPAPVEDVPLVTVSHSPLPNWDDAIEAYVAQSDGPAWSSRAVAQSPAVAIDPAVSPLESALLAGTAVALWGAWEARSRKDERRRSYLGISS